MENVQARKEELQGLIDSRKEELASGSASLATQNQYLSEIAAFESEIAAMETQAEQEAAQQVRIQEQEVKREEYMLPTDLNAFFSNGSYLNADGEPYVVTSANKIALQIVKDALTENDNEHNAKYADLESKYTALRAERDSFKKNSEDQTQLAETLRQQLSQTVIERDDAFSKRDAAVEEKKQRDAQESADLQKMIADEQAEKERKAAEDRAKRTVYDVVPDNDINPKNYTAKLASTGETVTFNWTQKNFYTVLTDEAEVSQFRLQHAEQSNQANPALDTPVEVPTIPAIPEVKPVQEAQFHEGTVQSGNEVDPGAPSADGPSAETVTRQEFESLRAEMNSKFNIVNDVVSVLAGRTGGIVTEEELQVAV
jgi:hypothetical protein